MPAMHIRDATDADLEAITAIYAHHVRHGTGSFELEPPTEAQMRERRDAVSTAGWPWLVAEHAGRIAGFAYANQYRPRPAYRYCVEDSVYVAPDRQRTGTGRTLLGQLIRRCESIGARQMVAVIGDSANTGSIGLHLALGFEAAGILRDSGWKFGRWLDTVFMQRALGAGAGAPGTEDPGQPERSRPR
ncbi:MAG: N-acetyltransferase family protein [Burkholderiaceae bacterium]|nr:N-acetyltransferase family protein [Burkholderiaceae bacterium]